MANDDDGPARVGSEDGDSAKVRERLAHLLTDLADDPNAPPSSVTAMSVIAAAKAAAQADPGAADEEPATPEEPAVPMTSTPTADVIEFRPRRRRFALAGLVAAASLAGISALVISLTVTGGSSTSTSADGARVVSAEAASSVESEAAQLALPPAAEASAAEPAAPEQPEAAAGAAPETSQAAGEAAEADSGVAGDTATPGCWPALGDRALSALTGTLPSGAYDSPLPLSADCEPGAVGGVIRPGATPGTVLVVRVTKAVPGACISDTSRGTACAATGDNIYVASDAAGSPVVYAYGNGNQVVVSGWPAAGDSVAVASGLTVEQSVAAAQAVLGAIG